MRIQFSREQVGICAVICMACGYCDGWFDQRAEGYQLELYNRAAEQPYGIVSGVAERSAVFIQHADATRRASPSWLRSSDHRAARSWVSCIYADASRNCMAPISKASARKMEGRFGDEIRQLLQADPGALTTTEAAYVLNFRDADALRARAAKAEDERGA
ncbi:hypothetical protein [Halovulum dunhuangense]|nr:hypothetical protein [Halovulum dunhuangense]